MLTIWWCPCAESSLVLLEEGVCCDHCVIWFAMTIALLTQWYFSNTDPLIKASSVLKCTSPTNVLLHYWLSHFAFQILYCFPQNEFPEWLCFHIHTARKMATVKITNDSALTAFSSQCPLLSSVNLQALEKLTTSRFSSPFFSWLP